MIFLYSMISSSKSMVGIIVIPWPCPCWTSASLATTFLCAVLLIILRLVSVRNALVRFCLPLAMLLSCLPLALLLCLLLVQIFVFFYSCSLDALLLPFRILNTCSLAVVPSVLLFQSQSLCGRLRLRGPILASSYISTQHCALRD